MAGKVRTGVYLCCSIFVCLVKTLQRTLSMIVLEAESYGHALYQIVYDILCYGN